MVKKIRFMFITEEECESLPDNLKKRFEIAKEPIGDKIICVATLSPYLLKRVQEKLGIKMKKCVHCSSKDAF